MLGRGQRKVCWGDHQPSCRRLSHSGEVYSELEHETFDFSPIVRKANDRRHLMKSLIGFNGRRGQRKGMPFRSQAAKDA
jgi:hypothetical protein